MIVPVFGAAFDQCMCFISLLRKVICGEIKSLKQQLRNNQCLYLFFVIDPSIDGYLFFATYWLFYWPLKVCHHMLHPSLL